MSLKNFAWINLILVFILATPLGIAVAQDESPEGPVYIVKAGDSLWDIAIRFGISMDELVQANGIGDPSQIAEGTELLIPGLSGLRGVLDTVTLPYGETLRSISRQFQIPIGLFTRLNRLSSPQELYTDSSIVIPVSENGPAGFSRSNLASNQSLLELAVLESSNPWSLVTYNSLGSTWGVVPGDILLLPGGESTGPAALPGEISTVELKPTPLLQGKTGVILLKAEEELSLSGNLMDHEMHFFQSQPGEYVALQGVHAMAEPGLYPMRLEGVLANGTTFAFSQMVPVGKVDYPFDRPLTVDPATIDPTVTGPEDAQWAALADPVSPVRMWNNTFTIPSPLSVDYCLETNDCWTSRFGNRRSYNGSAYNRFHTGLDIVGGSGTEIFAPAPGVVVFAGPLTVRGNATVIDHGWGVYSAYMHQSEIKVEVGDRVETGQVIGVVGGTGRVEGPHLHWEIWVGGVQVDPLDWLREQFP